MSFATDLNMGKWIVRRGDVPQDVIEKFLLTIKKSESAGQTCPNLLSLLYKQGIIDRTQAEGLKLAWKEHRESLKNQNAPNPVSEGPNGKAETEPVEDRPHPAQKGSTQEATSLAQPVKLAEENDAPPCPSLLKVTCIECQSANEPKEKDCQTCGAILPAQDLISCTICQHTQKKNRKNCYHCGCDLKSGKAGSSSASCRTCRTILMPGQVICLTCGSLYHERKSIRWAWAGQGLAAMQALLILGSASYLSMENASRDHLRKDTGTNIDFTDPYEAIPPRSIGESFYQQKLSIEDRTWLDKASQQKGRWRALESDIVKKEDRYGLHGALMLGLSFFEENRGLELVALAKAHPANTSLKALAAAWRLKQARKAFDRYEVKQALVQVRNLVQADDASGFHYFWAGVFAFVDQDLDQAKLWFKKSVASEQPMAQSHLFLYLLNKKDATMAEKHLNLLYQEVQDVKAIKSVIEPYLDKS